MVYRPTNNLPISQETTLNNAKKWLGIVRFGESGSVVQFQDDCEYRVAEIIENPKILKKFLGPYYRKYLLKYVSVDGQDLELAVRQSLLDLIRQRKLVLPEKEGKMTVNELLNYIAKNGFEVGLFIARITDLLDEPKFASLLRLELILQKSKNLSMILFFEKNITYLRYQALIDKASLLVDNFDYYPLYSESDSRQFLKYQLELWNLSISRQKETEILQLASGYLWLIAVLLRFYRDNPGKEIKEIIKEESFIRKLEVVWNKFSEEEKTIIKQPRPSIELTYLTKLGLIKKSRLALPILKVMIDHEIKLRELKLKNQEIWLNQEKIDDKLTKNEKLLLQKVLSQQKKILSREQLAQNLWGNDWEEKYSDWALDRLAYRLRNKLDELGVDSSLMKTKKKKGFYWG